MTSFRTPFHRVSAIAALALFALWPRAGSSQTIADLSGADPPANGIWMNRLSLSNMSQDFGSPHANESVDGNPITLKGMHFEHGVGTHARSEMGIDLKGVVTRFAAVVGVDDEKAMSPASVTFEVWADGKKIADSGLMRGGQEPKLISLDVTGKNHLLLVVTDGGDGIDSDHADWAGAVLIVQPGSTVRPQSAGIPSVPPRYVHVSTPAQPEIHGARIVGSTPGRPFLFLVPVTGEGPFTFSERRLPAGLTLDSATGVISGSLKAAGQTVVAITVKGAQGTARRSLTIVGGDHKLALTPPMGWNSWNCWAGAVDDGKVRLAADAMVKSGLAAHGFQYVNIDDTWEAGRDADGNIQSNEKFPDMKALSTYIHAKGLKLGIYSSPGPKTCAGFTASYQHEVQDARTWAGWGVDYLKHDWCSYGDVATGDGQEKFEKPYKWMRDALDKADRDIVFSLCQYGMGDVWKWGTEVGGNCWRTTGDINDSWGSLHGILESQNGHEKYITPGHWNDPDMLVVGKVGWGPSLHPSRLTPNEQLIHISMWCMLSSPLLIGCDMSQMDPFTIDLLSNDEALDINQDPLGKPAGRVWQQGLTEVWARPLFDGTKAVALVNAGAEDAVITANWSDLGITGKKPVRDLWLHKNVGDFEGSYGVSVPAHGCVLLKVGKPTGND